MHNAASLAHAVKAVLDQYVIVHDEVVGGSLWQSVRRALPIPGLFQAIPFAAHAKTLAALRDELRGVLDEIEVVLAEAPSEDAHTRFVRELEDYCHA